MIKISPSNPLNTKENIVAPINNINIMLVIFEVFIRTSFNIPLLKFLFINANNADPMAPNDEASVGVATPKIIEPRTISIKNRGE